ncbi:MAG: hypothetical protein JNL08_14405 [Planctomycetes bacterium]|nr:hypothetical protein [Planctomycetota bacterium]
MNSLRPAAGADARAWTAAVFAAGDYAGAAQHGDASTWQHHAALALLRGDPAAFAALASFPGEEPQLHRAGAHWVHGDLPTARRLLAPLSLPHAVRLRELLDRPRIRVLTQLPWLANTPTDLLGGARLEPMFELRNVGYHQSDLPNHPYASVAQFLDDGFAPDFYLAAMVEWQHVPPDLQRLPCPIFGHMADHDLHAQTLLPWLHLYDELCVTDRTEWLSVQGLCGAQVVSFPKVFGLPGDLPPVPTGARHVDCFVSGTMLDPYHPDKAALLHELLSLPDIDLRVVKGFTGPLAYRTLLAASKASFTFVRRPGAMPTRGLEALAMGCAVAVQEESSLRLFAGLDHGVVPYGPTTQPFAQALRAILADWPHHERAARRGAAAVRAQFAMPCVASQYLRFLTFRAAAPRAMRQHRDTRDWCQKRVSVSRTWLPAAPAARRRTMQANFRQLGRVVGRRPTVATLLDLARELLCEFLFYQQRGQATPVERALYDDAVRLLERCERLFPDALAPRFVRVRTLLHHGTAADRLEALQLAHEAIERGPDGWSVAPDHDVMPFDYHGEWFDYRTYLDLVLAAAKGQPVATRDLARLQLACLAGYVARKTGTIAHHEAAVALHPGFARQRLDLARALLARGGAAGRTRALALLQELAHGSCEFPTAARLLRDLEPDAAPDLALQRLEADTLDTAHTVLSLFATERRAAPAAAAAAPPPQAATSALVAVLVPHADVAAELATLLTDLAGQADAHRLEVLVARPAGTRWAADPIDAFAANFAALLPVPVAPGADHAARLEACRSRATAPFLTIACAGDRLRPDALVLLVEALDEHAADVAYGNDGWTATATAQFDPSACTAVHCWPPFAPHRLLAREVIGLHAVWRRSLHDVHGGFAADAGADVEHRFWRGAARTLTVHQLHTLLATAPRNGATHTVRAARRPPPLPAVLFAPALGDEAQSHARLGILDERTLQDVRQLEQFYGTALLHGDLTTAQRLLEACTAAVPNLLAAPLALSRLLTATGSPGARAVLEAARGRDPYAEALARQLAALPADLPSAIGTTPCRTPRSPLPVPT